MKKVYKDAAAALQDVPAGASVMFGGFGLCGIPENCIEALLARRVAGLRTISNDIGVDGFGLGLLLEAGLIAEHTGSYLGENHLAEQMVVDGRLKVNLMPQGTLAERIRAAGAGIPAFYTPAGVGTLVAEGKEVREFNGRKYLMELALPADYAMVKAWKGDTMGNLVYRGTARNFNPAMAAAGRVTIAEVDELVGPGEILPEEVHTPGIYVQRIFAAPCERRIEHRTVRKLVVEPEPWHERSRVMEKFQDPLMRTTSWRIKKYITPDDKGGDQ